MRPEPTILSFDTSAAHCAAALLTGGRIVASRFEEMAKGQAERLFPMLDAVLDDAGAVWEELDAIGVGVGPGNFTGVRIAVSAARGLALSLGVPAVGVSGFEVLAEISGDSGDIVAVLPAPRGACYAATVDANGGISEMRLDTAGPATARLSVPGGSMVIGSRATDLAYFGAGQESGYFRSRDLEFSDLKGRIAEAIAVRAARRLLAGQPIPRPAPLYIRPADAAPSSDTPPVILP